MKAVLCFFLIIAAVKSCPCGPCGPPPCGPPPCGPPPCEPPPECPEKPQEDIPIPSYCLPSWNVATFDDQYATKLIQGVWYLQMTTPTSIDGLQARKTGIFSNTFPNCLNRIIFKDTTPECSFDYNSEYVVLDSSYNVITQRMETSQTLWKPALGSKSPYAIFVVNTQEYYIQPIPELCPLEDESIIPIDVDTSFYKRNYLIASITKSENWEKYIVFVVINKYNNIFNPHEYIVWVLTRDVIPRPDVYESAMQDITDSGLNTFNLISINQVPDLSVLPNISKEDIEGVVISKSFSSSSSSSSTTKSISTNEVEFEQTSTSESSSTYVSTETTEIISTVEITIDKGYTIEYDYDLYEYCSGIKILKNLQTELIKEAFSGIWYLNSATPCALSNSDNINFGLLQTTFPWSSQQLIFDNKMDCDDSDLTTMTLYRAYDMITGEIKEKRILITPAFSDFTWSLFNIYIEGSDQPEEYTPLSIEGLLTNDFGQLYQTHYTVAIAGYSPDFLIVCLVNQIKNVIYDYEKYKIPQLFIFTREPAPTFEVTSIIAQEIGRIGYNPNFLSVIDQSTVIEKEYSFQSDYFQYSYSSSSTLLTSSTKEISKTTTSTSVSRSVDISSSSNDINLPITTLPAIVPPNFQVATFDCDTNAFQGVWNLQMATPTFINGYSPLKTGFFTNTFPSCCNRFIFKDTTPDCPFDYNADYVVLDTSYNILTNRMETTQTLLKSAYGPNSPFAIFNLLTENYYQTPLSEETPLIDDLLINHKIEDNSIYKREYTVCCITQSKNWDKYMVLVLLNTYDNIYIGKEDHIIWVLTRDSIPESTIYESAINDILNSGLYPYNLMSIYQVPDLSLLPNISQEDIEGVVKSTTVTSSSSTTKSISTSEVESEQCSTSTKSSSYSSTKTTEIISTVEITVDEGYTIDYEYDSYEFCSGIKILKNLQAEVIRKAFSGVWYLNSATPCALSNIDETNLGLLHTSVPASSLQIIFDSEITTPWDNNEPNMMLFRGYNLKTGEIYQKRNFISSAYSDNTWSTFIIDSEDNLSLDDYSQLSLEGALSHDFGELYHSQYVITVAGYEQDKYLILCLANKIKNTFFNTEEFEMPQLYVFTRDQSINIDYSSIIAQELYRIGYNPNHLVKIDQSKVIEQEYVFSNEYFQYSYSSSVQYESSTTTERETSMSYSSSKSSLCKCAASDLDLSITDY